jgi:predicted permease
VQADYSSLLFMSSLLFLGFAMRKTHLLQTEHIEAIPILLLNIAYPALIITSVTSVDIKSLAKESIFIVSATAVFTLMIFAGGLVVLRKYRRMDRKPLLLFSAVVGNIAYVALPVIRAVFGDAGVFYAMLHCTVQDIIIWTLYYTYFTCGGSLRGIKIGNLASPCLAALIIAIMLALAGLKPQGVIAEVLEALAGITVPLALVFVGGMFAVFGWNAWVPDKATIAIAMVKVVGVPLFIFGILQLAPVSNELRLLLAVFFAAPSTVLSTVWAKLYHLDVAFSIKTLILSTLIFMLVALVFFAMIKSGVII